MGKFITVPMTLVKPTQYSVSDYSFKEILSAYYSFGRHLIPPIPVRSYLDEYLLLDGHHRAAVEHFFGAEQLTVYLAKSQDDLLDSSKFPESMNWSIGWNNTNISTRFFRVVDERPAIVREGIDSITTLPGYSKLKELAKEWLLT